MSQQLLSKSIRVAVVWGLVWGLISFILAFRGFHIVMWGVVIMTLIVIETRFSKQERCLPSLWQALLITLSFFAPAALLLFFVYSPVVWHRLVLFGLSVIVIFNVGACVYVRLARWEEGIRRSRHVLSKERHEMKYSFIVPFVGGVMAIFWFGLAIISNTIGRNETTSWMVTFLFVFFGVLSLLLVVLYIFARYIVSEEGLSYPTFLGLGPKRFLRWQDVTKVDYSLFWRWFVVETHSGRKARVPYDFMEGMEQFISAIERHVPSDAISPRAKEMFRFLTQINSESNLT